MVDQSRRSPLHYAVEKGLTRIVQVVDGVGDNDDDDDDDDMVMIVMMMMIMRLVHMFIMLWRRGSQDLIRL